MNENENLENSQIGTTLVCLSQIETYISMMRNELIKDNPSKQYLSGYADFIYWQIRVIKNICNTRE